MEDNAHRWERLEELFAAAADLPRDRQDAFVEHETASDPDLRRKLRALLDHDSGAGQRIAQAIQSAAPPPQWTGGRAGPYRIVREIGRGGMGLVFEAVRDDDEYRKTVALKIAPWCRNLDLLRERFRRERQILAGLEHPNIARLIDGGTHDDVPYFAMEFVEGRPITEYAVGRKLREKIELFREVCAAVHHAHQSLVVHRDLKPANILVSEQGVPKLLDFGIAKLLGPSDADGTVTGIAPWTPDYASPEQIRGGPITTRTDVYSLGLILFEMLTGERAQIADNSSPRAMDHSICEAETPRASTKAPGVLARQLAGDLDTIVAKATQKEPERRYASVAEFSDDLGRYLDGRPVRARKDSTAYRASKFVRRNWLPVGATAVAMLGLAGGAIGFAWQARVAQRRFDQVRKLATVFLFDVHDKVQTLPGATGVREMLTSAAVDSLDGLARDAGRNYELRRELAAAYLRLGRVQGDAVGSSFGRTGDALASFEKGLALLHGMPESQSEAAAETEGRLRTSRGRLLLITGRPVEAEPELKRALEILTPLCTAGSAQKALCEARMSVLTALAELATQQSQASVADSYLRKLDQTAEALRSSLSPALYQAQWLRSRILWSKVEWIRSGGAAGVDALRPALPAAAQLAATSATDVDAMRIAVNVCIFYGSMALDLKPDADLRATLHHGVDWASQLVNLDPKDRRSQTSLAEIRSLLGRFLVPTDPAAAFALLRPSLHETLDELRLSPRNVNLKALLIETANYLVKAAVGCGREAEAVADARDVLQFYNPLSSIGLSELNRSDTVRDLQARAWVARERAKAGSIPDGSDREAARRAETALEKDPADPALEAAAASLYDSLPGTPAERGQWYDRAAGLWHSLAARFPGNKSLHAAR
ncbi:MAG TPA: serine/threonine-protein kinase [Bryobacteraceae bacterium]|nr:serine/threonine-protein kinase [Bryobacteraceae bacterium]